MDFFQQCFHIPAEVTVLFDEMCIRDRADAADPRGPILLRCPQRTKRQGAFSRHRGALGRERQSLQAQGLSLIHILLGEELTACGTISELSRRISVIRSRNISMSCVFQNLAGLQNRYPQNQWQEILGNCDVQLFLGCTDQLTAEYVSQRTGIASVAVRCV